MYRLIFKGIPNVDIIHNNFILARSSTSKCPKKVDYCSFKGAATSAMLSLLLRLSNTYSLG